MNACACRASSRAIFLPSKSSKRASTTGSISCSRCCTCAWWQSRSRATTARPWDVAGDSSLFNTLFHDPSSPLDPVKPPPVVLSDSPDGGKTPPRPPPVAVASAAVLAVVRVATVRLPRQVQWEVLRCCGVTVSDLSVNGEELLHTSITVYSERVALVDTAHREFEHLYPRW